MSKQSASGKADLTSIQDMLKILGEKIKLDYSFSTSTNVKLGPEHKKSQVILKIENELDILNRELARNSKSAIPSIFLGGKNRELTSKINNLNNLRNQVLYVESELNNIREVIDNYRDKLGEDAKKKLIKNFDEILSKGAKGIEDACKLIDKSKGSEEIVKLSKEYQSSLETIKKPEKARYSSGFKK